jgi:hypothetical protein
VAEDLGKSDQGKRGLGMEIRNNKLRTGDCYGCASQRLKKWKTSVKSDRK